MTQRWGQSQADGARLQHSPHPLLPTHKARQSGAAACLREGRTQIRLQQQLRRSWPQLHRARAHIRPQERVVIKGRGQHRPQHQDPQGIKGLHRDQFIPHHQPCVHTVIRWLNFTRIQPSNSFIDIHTRSSGVQFSHSDKDFSSFVHVTCSGAPSIIRNWNSGNLIFTTIPR